VDHLVFAAPDLDEGVRFVEDLLGVQTFPGGQHQGLGTRNRLIGLGPDCYMEVVSIDPDQGPPRGTRWFGLDDLTECRLVSWCAKGAALGELVARGRRAGIDLGDPSAGGRLRPDGSHLSWTFTDPWADRAGGVVPFFIDWGDSAHPASDLVQECSFRGLRVEHPEAESVSEWLRALGLDTAVTGGGEPRVVATIETPRGLVELR
jgi:catechol 2,3-dioxygenase-like lactoylglutathione lyase family enzyme